MSTVIYPRALSGTLTAPGSKSYCIRQLILAAFADTPTDIVCNNLCSDVLAAIDCLMALGAKISTQNGVISVIPVANSPKKCVYLNCRESAAVLRFMLPLVCVLGCEAELSMSRRLSERPIDSLIGALCTNGASIAFTDELTLKVGGGVTGRRFYIPADISSQYASGLMLALAAAGGGKVNITSEINSSAYIGLTLECLKCFGVSVLREGKCFNVSGVPHSPSSLVCEGDWSGAAYWLCAGAIGRAPLSVSGLNPNSVQGDRDILNILKSMGAEIITRGDTVTVSPRKLYGISIDAKDIPDLVPVLAVVCACAEGESRICNVSRLREKESDRVLSVCNMINSLGGTANYTDDAVIIKGGGIPGGSVKTCGDHRIIMSAAVASCVCREQVVLDGFDAFSKSYLGFADDFLLCGGKYESL